MAIGPPIIILIVPVKKRISALGPNFFIPGMSTLIVNNARLAGSRYLDAIK